MSPATPMSPTGLTSCSEPPSPSKEKARPDSPSYYLDIIREMKRKDNAQELDKQRAALIRGERPVLKQVQPGNMKRNIEKNTVRSVYKDDQNELANAAKVPNRPSDKSLLYH